jgi:hypothetical protein
LAARALLYRDALPLLNSGRVELLDVPRLAAQLCSLERRTVRGGKDSIDHPPGAHDDLANAVAGVVTLAAVRRSLVISDGVPARFAAPVHPAFQSPGRSPRCY